MLMRGDMINFFLADVMEWRSLETYHPSPSFTLISFKPVYKDLIRNVLPKHDNISLFSLKIYLFPVLKVIASSIILQNIINHPSEWFHISSFSINVAAFIFHFSYFIYISSSSNLETFIFLCHIPYFKLFKCCNNLHVEDNQLRSLLIASMAADFGFTITTRNNNCKNVFSLQILFNWKYNLYSVVFHMLLPNNLFCGMIYIFIYFIATRIN